MEEMITVTVSVHDLRAVIAHGNGHAHLRPATWDRNGLPCDPCLALGRLQAACDEAARTDGNAPSSSGVEYRCPGGAPYGHGLTEQTVHLAGCCERFAALPVEQQAAIGLRYPTYAPFPSGGPA